MALFPIGLLALPSGPDAMFLGPKQYLSKATSPSQRLLDPPQYFDRVQLNCFKVQKWTKRPKALKCAINAELLMQNTIISVARKHKLIASKTVEIY